MEHNIISVSGGKDSTALLLLAIERQPDNMQAVFADTGNEHPMTYDYVRYLEQATGVPIKWVKADFSAEINARREKLSAMARGEKVPRMDWPPERAAEAAELMRPTGNPFLDLCIMKGLFPSTKARFCSEELKRNPIIEQIYMPLLEAGNVVISWQDVRADESANRANLPESEDVGGGLWNYRPILKLTAEGCFAMHRKHGIKHNPLYELGMGRVGCMPCIHERKDSLLEISKRFPEEVERIAEWERIVSSVSKRGSSTFMPSLNRGETPSECYKAGNIHAVIEWSKTGRGGKTIDMFRANDEPAMCSSIYGLCE